MSNATVEIPHKCFTHSVVFNIKLYADRNERFFALRFFGVDFRRSADEIEIEVRGCVYSLLIKRKCLQPEPFTSTPFPVPQPLTRIRDAELSPQLLAIGYFPPQIAILGPVHAELLCHPIFHATID